MECEGEQFGHSPDREVAQAAAHRKAREMQDGGKPCQVKIMGDNSWAAA